jgi:hypothetical protein
MSFEELSCTGMYGGKRFEVEVDQVYLSWLQDIGECLFALGQVACGAEDMGTGRLQSTGCFDADS